jgi:hypothetical protein
LARATADAGEEAQAATDLCAPAIQRFASILAANKVDGHDFETLQSGFERRALIDVIEARAAGCDQQDQ